jgi:cell division protein FtsB
MVKIKQEDISHWRMDKRIPIAIVLSLFLQFAAAIVWGAKLDARVVSLEQQGAGSIGFGEKLARIDERLNAVQQDTNSIKHEIETLTNRVFK